MNYDEEVEKFLALFGINNSTSAMRSQKIKIHELLKLIEKDDSYTMPDKTKPFNKTCIKEFLIYSQSTYSAAKVLFGKEDYSYNVIDFPRETANFSNKFLTNSSSKYNIVMPNDYPIDIFTNTLLLRYFPIEWIIENFIIDEEKIVVRYNDLKNQFYLEKFDDSAHKIQTCLSMNVSAIQKATDLNRLNEIYTLYLEKDA